MKNVSEAGAEINPEELNSLPECIKKKLETLKHPRSRQQAEWALFYTILGIPVFPVKTDGKTPHIEAWQRKATTDPDTVAGWFCGKFQGEMIGCPAGAMGGMADPGLILIDVDVKDGAKGKETLMVLEQELGLKLSDLTELTAYTPSSGWHYWLRWPEGVEIKNRGGGLGKGIDIRGCGADGATRGYGILPPSKNAKSGSYRWENAGLGPLAAITAKEPPLPLLWLLVFNERERERLRGVKVCEPKDMPCDPPEWREMMKKLLRDDERRGLPSCAINSEGVLVEAYSGRVVSYVEAGIRGELQEMENAAEGDRNRTRNDAGMCISSLIKGAAVIGVPREKVEEIRNWAFERFCEFGDAMEQKETASDHWERCWNDAGPRSLKGKIAWPEDEFDKFEETAEELAALLDAAIADPEAVENRETVIEQCAKLRHLDALGYEPRRLDIAKVLKSRAQVLEREVEKAAKRLKLFDENDDDDEATKGVFSITPREPCSQPVEGGALVDEITAGIRRYVILDEDAAKMAALWIVFTYVHNAKREHSPLLAIQAATKGAGKTTMLSVVQHLVEKPLPTVNATEAAIFRSVAKWEPTLLMDEADTWIHDNENLRGLLNAGFEHGQQALRCVGEEHDVQAFPPWCPKALAGIGKLPDTIQDRSLVINMRRKQKGGTTERLDTDAKTALGDLASKIARWAKDNIDALREARIDDLDELGDRENDKWRPLLQIAAACGKLDEARATAMAVQRGQRSRRDSEDTALKLLRHACEIFEVLNAEYLNPETLRQCLVGGERAGIPRRRGDEADVYDEIEGVSEGYWRDCDPRRAGQEITMNRMSATLKGLDLMSKQKKIEGNTARYYERTAFQEVLKRYS